MAKTNLSSHISFSRKHLTVFILLFALIGGIVLLQSRAASTSYYVSPTGSDSNNGTSPSSAWRTIAKVNNTCFQPGDIVAFEGGKIFGDTYLSPSCSGSELAPITFTSYGTGKAMITKEVYLNSNKNNLTFDNLDITSQSSGIFASCSSCINHNITLKNSYIHDTPYLGISTSTGDTNWKILNNRIERIGDSGIINYYATNVLIDGNTFYDTGWNPAITDGKHAIYSKARDVVISNNDFSKNTPNGQSISIRTANQRIFGNKIHDTPAAFGFFDYDITSSPQGTSYIYNNKIWNTTSYGFYYGGQLDPNGKPPSVSFVIASNTFVASSGEMFNLSEVPSTASIKTVNNIFSGTFGSAYRGCGTCVENNNLWFGGTNNIPSGVGDLKVNPSISPAPNFVPNSTSPVINAGTNSVAGLTYSPTCNGQPLSYCSSVPDMGAVEYSSTITKPGDANNDGLVNITDLSILLTNYGTNYPQADFNKDGTVNITDLSILLTNYGK